MNLMCQFKNGKCVPYQTGNNDHYPKTYFSQRGFIENLIMMEKISKCSPEQFYVPQMTQNGRETGIQFLSANQSVPEAFISTQVITYQEDVLAKLFFHPKLIIAEENFLNSLLIIEKSRVNYSGKRQSNFYSFTLKHFLQMGSEDPIKIYADQIKISLVIKTPIEYSGPLQLLLVDATPNLIFNILVVFLAIFLSIFLIFFLYYICSYLYYVLYHRQYDMNLIRWMRGERPRLNMNFYLKSGYFEIMPFKIGCSKYEENQCSICMSEFV